MEENLPNHIAIIPDGNRRWARERNLRPWEGHEAGAKNLEGLVRFLLKKGIQCLSFWGSSLDNLSKRPLQEKKALLDIYKRYFTDLMNSREIHENEVKIHVIGRWEEQFPESLKKIIREAIHKTARYKKKILNFMVAYSGIDEMTQAIQNIQNRYEKGTRVTSEMIKENLMTASIPPVDYVIRTGGEPHLSSGFMMWDTADAQLYFSEKKFPEFGDPELEEALQEYMQRKRRFGK